MTRLLWTAAGGLLVALSAALMPRAVRADEGLRDDRDCGPICVGTVLGLRGMEIPGIAELRARTGTDDTGVCSLGGVRRALLEYGVAANPVTLTEEPPSALTVAMTRTQSSRTATAHFIVLKPVGGGEVIVYCPPLRVQSVAWARLRGSLEIEAVSCPESGLPYGQVLCGLGALLALGGAVRRLRRRGLPPSVGSFGLILVPAALFGSAGCGAAPEPREPEVRVEFTPARSTELGLIAPGVHTALVKVRNAGEAPVECLGVSASCGCLGPAFDPGVLLPGQERTCTLRVNAKPGDRRTVVATFDFGHAGKRFHQLTYETSFEGVTGTGVKDLGAIDVGKPHTTRLEATIALSVLGGKVPTAELVQWQVYRDAPLRIVRSGMTTAAETVPPTLTVYADAEVQPKWAGAGSGQVAVILGGEFSLPFEVNWTASSPFAIEPKSVVLRREGDAYAGSVTVTPSPGLRIEEVTCEDAGMSVTADRAAGAGRMYRIAGDGSWGRSRGVATVTVRSRSSGNDVSVGTFLVVADPMEVHR